MHSLSFFINRARHHAAGWPMEIPWYVMVFLFYCLFIIHETFVPGPSLVHRAGLTITILLIFATVAWWLVKTIWPVLAEYTVEHFRQDFKGLKPWQRVVIAVTFYVVCVYAFIATLAAVT